MQAPCYCRTRSEHRERNSDCYQVNRVSDTVSVRIYALCAQHLRVRRRQKRKVSGGMKYRLRHSKATLQQLCAVFFHISTHIRVQALGYCRTRSEHRERNSDCYEVNRVSDTVSVRIYALGAQHLRVRRRQKRKVSGGMKYRLRHSKATLQQLCAVFFHISTHIRVQALGYCRTRSEHRERNSDCYEVNRVSDTVSVRIYALGAQHLRVRRRQKRKVSGGI